MDNVDILAAAGTLRGRKARAKGFFDPATGRITLILSNHSSAEDAVWTLLHEAVAHYGLRRLFGVHFDAFLREVYEGADRGLRRRIASLSARHGWDVAEATEEYLAGLAEDEDFERASRAGWWEKIKAAFVRMLHKVGAGIFAEGSLTDAELCYVLWRSYENLTEPDRYVDFAGGLADVAVRSRLKVGDFAPSAPSTASSGRRGLG